MFGEDRRDHSSWAPIPDPREAVRVLRESMDDVDDQIVAAVAIGVAEGTIRLARCQTSGRIIAGTAAGRGVPAFFHVTPRGFVRA